MWPCPRPANTPDVGVSPRGGCSNGEEGGGEAGGSPARRRRGDDPAGTLTRRSTVGRGWTEDSGARDAQVRYREGMKWRVGEPAWWGVGIVLAGILAFAVAGEGRVNASLVAATLVVLLWYTVETRRLRMAQEHEIAQGRLVAELREHPWLEASTLRPEIRTPQREGAPHELVLYLPVTNKVRGPRR